MVSGYQRNDKMRKMVMNLSRKAAHETTATCDISMPPMLLVWTHPTNEPLRTQLYVHHNLSRTRGDRLALAHVASAAPALSSASPNIEPLSGSCYPSSFSTTHCVGYESLLTPPDRFPTSLPASPDIESSLTIAFTMPVRGNGMPKANFIVPVCHPSNPGLKERK